MGSSGRIEFKLLMNFNTVMNWSVWVEICGFFGNIVARRGLTSTVSFSAAALRKIHAVKGVSFCLGF